MAKIPSRAKDIQTKLANCQQDATSAESFAKGPVQVGARIRALRKQRGLTIRALATRCQISPNTLSLIENERTSPSIRTLGQLAQGLGENIVTLLAPESAEQSVFFQKRGERPITPFSNGTIEDLGDGLPPLGVEPILIELVTHQTVSQDVIHAVREFVYCIDGSVTCVISGKKYPLSVGDSLLFDAGVCHRWENTHSHPSKMLVLFCPMNAKRKFWANRVEQHVGQ